MYPENTQPQPCTHPHTPISTQTHKRAHTEIERKTEKDRYIYIYIYIYIYTLNKYGLPLYTCYIQHFQPISQLSWHLHIGV